MFASLVVAGASAQEREGEQVALESRPSCSRTCRELRSVRVGAGQIQIMDDTGVWEFCDRPAWCLWPHHAMAGWCKLSTSLSE